jgi:hypothetical protein
VTSAALCSGCGGGGKRRRNGADYRDLL